MDDNKQWKILKVMGIPDHLTCLLIYLYAGKEDTVRIRYGTTDWFTIGKGLCQGCILSPCLFNLYAKCVHAQSLQLCPTLCDPMDCSLPISSVHGDSAGKNTGVGCHALLRGSSRPRGQTHVSCLLHWQAGSLWLAPYMQSTSCGMLGWMTPVGIKIAGRNINLRHADDITLMSESEEKLKSLLMRVKVDSWKTGLKQHSKN